MVDVGSGEPSFWVWITEEMVPGTVQEPSGIDNESYVIVGEEQVVDGIANFMARCILANPKSRVRESPIGFLFIFSCIIFWLSDKNSLPPKCRA